MEDRSPFLVMTFYKVILLGYDTLQSINIFSFVFRSEREGCTLKCQHKFLEQVGEIESHTSWDLGKLFGISRVSVK